MVPVSRLSPPHRIYGTRHEICGRERMHTERAQFWGQPHAPPQAKQVHDLAPSLWVTQNHTALSLSCPLHSPPIPLPMNSALIWLPCPNISLPNSFISTQSGWHFKKKGTVPSKLQNFYIKTTTITIEQKAGDLEDSVDSLGAHELRISPLAWTRNCHCHPHSFTFCRIPGSSSHPGWPRVLVVFVSPPKLSITASSRNWLSRLNASHSPISVWLCCYSFYSSRASSPAVDIKNSFCKASSFSPDPDSGEPHPPSLAAAHTEQSPRMTSPSPPGSTTLTLARSISSHGHLITTGHVQDVTRWSVVIPKSLSWPWPASRYQVHASDFHPGNSSRRALPSWAQIGHLISASHPIILPGTKAHSQRSTAKEHGASQVWQGLKGASVIVNILDVVGYGLLW